MTLGDFHAGLEAEMAMPVYVRRLPDGGMAAAIEHGAARNGVRVFPRDGNPVEVAARLFKEWLA